MVPVNLKANAENTKFETTQVTNNVQNKKIL